MNIWRRRTLAVSFAALFVMLSIAGVLVPHGEMTDVPNTMSSGSNVNDPSSGSGPFTDLVVTGSGWTLSASFRYLGESSLTELPCSGACVVLDVISQTGWSYRANGYTDEQGDIQFSGLEDGTYSVRVLCYDIGTVRVQDLTEEAYSWGSGEIELSSDSSIELVIESEDRGAWSAYDSVREGAEWTSTNFNWSRMRTTVVWPMEDWAHCHGNEIHLPGPMDGTSDVWDRDVVLHEYGHAVHYALRGSNFPDYDGPDTHYLDSETNGKFAFMEGWAEFFSAAVLDNPKMRGFTSLESTMFADRQNSNGDYGDWDGNDVEGAVANVLWDIYDGTSPTDHPQYLTNAVGDMVAREMNELWRVMRDERPENMMDVWKAWSNKSDTLVQIFRYARFDVDMVRPQNPTGFISGHKVWEHSGDSTVHVKLIGATDDSSSPIGYSVVWSDRPDSIPYGIATQWSDEFTSSPLPPGTWYVHIRAVDYSGNVANDTYHIGPFLIDEDAVDISDNGGSDDLTDNILFDVVVLIGIILFAVIFIIIVMRMVREPEDEDVGLTERERFMADMYSRWYQNDRRLDNVAQPPVIGATDNYCPYCGQKDLHGTFCGSCGKRLR